MQSVALMVIAKQPVAGRVKTRLTPPCTPEQAAALAGAALLDTLAAVAATEASRRILVFDGDPSGWLPPGFDHIPQCGSGLGDRLQAAFDAVGQPAVLVGMDTPQLTAELLQHAATLLSTAGNDAVLGLTPDGGYWLIGFNRAVAGAFGGVPMSTARTGAHQLRRLRELNLRVATIEPLRDVDTIDDARAVALHAPRSNFARALHRASV